MESMESIRETEPVSVVPVLWEVPDLLQIIKYPATPELLFGSDRTIFKLHTEDPQFEVATSLSAADANDQALFNAGPQFPAAPRGFLERITQFMSNLLGGGRVIMQKQRLRFHDSDAFITPLERIAVRILVEGGKGLVIRLQTAGVTMDTVVDCGITMDEWLDAALTFADVVQLGGNMRHLFQMAILPSHVFGRKNGTKVLSILCVEPFFLNWESATIGWGFTLDEGIRHHRMSITQIALLGDDMARLVKKHAFVPEYIDIIGEPATSYRSQLSATDEQINFLFNIKTKVIQSAETAPLMPRPTRTHGKYTVL
jgi:hypothetical protein